MIISNGKQWFRACGLHVYVSKNLVTFKEKSTVLVRFGIVDKGGRHAQAYVGAAAKYDDPAVRLKVLVEGLNEYWHPVSLWVTTGPDAYFALARTNTLVDRHDRKSWAEIKASPRRAYLVRDPQSKKPTDYYTTPIEKGDLGVSHDMANG